ncbi:MAG: homoserine dehydrogenase [Acidiferrobacterales bacterium]|nr:homoserine dehydrogenase [Acidiferrobacterales bacterium]
MKIVKVGILGLGTVGGGVANVLRDNADEISRRTSCSIQLTMASVRNFESQRLYDCSDIELTEDPKKIVENPDIDIVIETIGGDSIAKELILTAISNGKHVVTANKALIALHGDEIFAKAEKNNVSVLYEAAVAGGISVIKDIREGLSANKLEMIAGIINGTGNFILTEMRDKGRSFDEVLAEAQELGYAEADPTFDVEGIDAAHKLSILASVAFGIPLSFKEIYCEGISSLSLIDVAYADELGYRIKHLGIAKQHIDGVELRVHPTLIPEKHLIANVDGVMNAVMVQGDAVGCTLHYGAGAGSLPTASAVVADVIDITRALTSGVNYSVPALGFDEIDKQEVKQPEEFVCAHYLRVDVFDNAGVLSKLSKVFADLDVSIEAIIQKEPKKDAEYVSVIFITQETLEARITLAIDTIKSMDYVCGEIVRIRLEHLD